jgi:hypothetical protein
MCSRFTNGGFSNIASAALLHSPGPEEGRGSAWWGKNLQVMGDLVGTEDR